MEWNREGQEFFADGLVRTHRASLNFWALMAQCPSCPWREKGHLCIDSGVHWRKESAGAEGLGLRCLTPPSSGRWRRGAWNVLPHALDMQVPCPRELYIPRLWDRPVCRWPRGTLLE